MEGRILNKQGTIQTASYVLWTVQFTGDIPKDNEQYLLRVTSRKSTGKLHRQFCDTCKDQGRTGRTDNQILKDSRKTQLGVIVRKEQVKIEQEKIKAVKE